MSRDGAGRHDRRDERQPIGGRRHVPVGEPRPFERPSREDPRCVANGNVMTRSRDVHCKRVEVLALDHRQAFVRTMERFAVIGGIQLAAEAQSPSVIVARRRKAESDVTRDPRVEGRAQLGNRDVIAGELPDERHRNRHRPAVHSRFRQPIEIGRRTDARPHGHGDR